MAEHNDIEIRSEEVQDILTAVPNWMIRWGNTLVFFLILLLIFVTWWVKYPDVITSQAMITTQVPLQKEYARVNGKIDTLLVSNQQPVQADAPLAIIENTANYEDVYFLKSILDTIQLHKQRFSFPLNNIPFLFLGDLEAEYALFESNYEHYLLNQQLQPYALQAEANKEAMIELKARLKTLENQKALTVTEMELKSKNLERVKKMEEEGLISSQESEALEAQNLRDQQHVENINLAISQINALINQTSFSKDNTRLNQTREEKLLLRKVIQSYHQLKQAIKDWEHNYVLKSSIDGTVTLLDIYTKNQTVRADELVFTIIPQQSNTYIAKLKAPAANAGKLAIGQKVQIHLFDYPEYEYGSLLGKVQHISQVADANGEYHINVSLPDTLETSYRKVIDFKQEMQGTAEIITDDLRLIERFFYRFKAMFKG